MATTKIEPNKSVNTDRLFRCRYKAARLRWALSIRSDTVDTSTFIKDFRQVATLAGIRLEDSDLEVEHLSAPHKPPSKLPKGMMAVYVFTFGDTALKVGKVGPNSAARYTSQHYNASSAASTLAGSLLKNGHQIGAANLTIDSVGDWIKENTCRTNFLLNANVGIPVLTLLESFLQCRLKPKFEGFASQR